MKKLYKILEEIEKLKKMYKESSLSLIDKGNLPCEYDKSDIESAKMQAIWEAITIIRKHINDGWIPVEDRLPEENGDDGELIVTDKDGRIWSGIYYGITEETDEYPCFHKWDEEMWHCYKPDVIAWRPLPEPYRPERSEEE